MSYARRRDSNVRQTFGVKTPHFLKIILAETIRDRKLEIPRTFVGKHGEDLTESVQLKVPTGAVWKVELKKCDDNIWFQKGWDKFVESYSIEHGYFLVFGYEGNSKFHVLIFDHSASEIEYPLLNSIHDDEKPNIKKSDSEEVLSDSEVVPCQRKRKESPSLPCFGPKKMMRTNSTIKSEKVSTLDQSKKGDSHGAMPEFEEAKGCGQSMSKTQRWPKSEVSQRQQSSSADAKARALERAKAFKSEHPFYVVSIYPSHVLHVHTNHHKNIPSSFMSTFLTAESGNIILWVSEGKSWSVKYHRFTERNKIRGRISWKAFSQDNCLKVGDACVFGFIQSFEISIKVSIFRAADEANCDESKLPASLSNSQILCSLEAESGFKSEYPFFKAVMLPSYLQHGTLVVPKSFANRYINKSALTVTLQVADRFWQVKVLKTGRSTRLSAGWRAFVRDNALQSGDVCAFELIERNGDIFKVTIIRFPGLSSTP